jgi:hypothetical protein
MEWHNTPFAGTAHDDVATALPYLLEAQAL